MNQECRFWSGVPRHAHQSFMDTRLFSSLFQQGAWPKTTDCPRQRAFLSFPCHLGKPNKSFLGPCFQSFQGCNPNCSTQTEWRGSQTSTFKTSLEVHTHTLCMNPSLHLNLNPFPEWSRRRDCPAGATLACSDLLLPRQAPCKAMSKP